MRIHLFQLKLIPIYFFMLLTALDGLVIPTLIAGIIHSVEQKSLYSLINYFIFGIVGYCTIRTALYLWNLSQQKYIQDFNNKYKGIMIRKYFISNNASLRADLLSFIINDFKYLESNYIKSLFLLIYCVAFSMISALYVLVIDYKLGILFILFSIIPVITPKLYKNKIKFSTDNWSTSSSNFMNHINEYFRALTTISVFNKRHYFISRLSKDLINVEQRNFDLQKNLFQSNWITNLLSGFSSFLPLFIGGIFVIKGDLSLAALMAVYLASDRIVIPAVNAIDHYNKLKSSDTIIEKYNNLMMQLENGNNLKEELIQSKNTFLPILFDNVTHRYGERTILKDVTLSINKGDHILLRGASGSGKSTIFKLLLSFEKPERGKILFNNIDSNLFQTPTIADDIHYFEQEPFIFNESILFNITLGDDFEKHHINQVIEMCKLDTLIQTHGLSYSVGSDGEFLSGGQKMRIALARILVRNPKFVLLDEFSAGLDSENAIFIRDILHTNIETVIEITHDKDLNYNYYNKIFKIEACSVTTSTL